MFNNWNYSDENDKKKLSVLGRISEKTVTLTFLVMQSNSNQRRVRGAHSL